MSTQVALVKITENGSDVGLYVNGEYIISADPGCGDSVDTVQTVAENLAATFKINLIEVDYAAKEDWQWNDVEDELKASQVIQSAS